MKSGVEGTLFVCQLTPSPITGAERHCIVILNRKGLENVIIESGEIANVEITDEFLLLQFNRQDDSLGGEVSNILGFFMHDYEEFPREHICQLVKQHWEIAMADRAQTESQAGMVENYADESFGGKALGVEYKPMGRRLSLTELFGQR